MRICYFIFFSISFSVILTSCDSLPNKERQEEAQGFLNEIDKTVYNLNTSDSFSRYFKIVAPIAQKNGANFQLPQSKIDSLKSYFDSYIHAFDKAITRLNSMNEFDTSFDLLKLNVRELDTLRNAMAKTIPTHIYIYKIGWSLASGSEKELILNTGKILTKATFASTEIQKELEANQANVLFHFHVGPAQDAGAGKCFEMLFDTDGNLYYYNFRKITNDNPDGFNLNDFNNIM